MVKLNILSFLIIFFTSQSSWAEGLRLYVQEFIPFTHTDAKTGEIHGILADKVAEIMKRSGQTYQLSVTSLARGLNAVQQGEHVCLFGFRRTPEREADFKWVGPLISDAWVLYGRKSEPHNLKRLEDSKPYLIGSYKNAATGLQLAKQGYRINFANQDSDNPRLLSIGRIDYWVVSELHGLALAQQQGLAQDMLKVLKYRQIDLYMLCNQKMDKNRIDLFNKLNKEIDNDGTMDKLLRKYSDK